MDSRPNRCVTVPANLSDWVGTDLDGVYEVHTAEGTIRLVWEQDERTATIVDTGGNFRLTLAVPTQSSDKALRLVLRAAFALGLVREKEEPMPTSLAGRIGWLVVRNRVQEAQTLLADASEEERQQERKAMGTTTRTYGCSGGAVA